MCIQVGLSLVAALNGAGLCPASGWNQRSAVSPSRRCTGSSQRDRQLRGILLYVESTCGPPELLVLNPLDARGMLEHDGHSLPVERSRGLELELVTGSIVP
jgi:hypothetical protein